MPEPPPDRSHAPRDFLSWGKEFLKEALSKPAEPQRRATRPLARGETPARQTTFLPEDPTTLAEPRATVAEIARLRIVFVDNGGRPLYEPLAPHDLPFTADTERVIHERALGCLREVAGRLAAVVDLVPRGKFTGLPLGEVLATVTVRDLRSFFYFVRENPRFFLGERMLLAEAFVAWVVDHGVADPPANP